MTAYVRPDLRDRGNSPFGSPWAIRGVVVRAVKNRATIRFESDGQTYYLKRHDRIGIAEILKNLVVGKWPAIGADNEYRACRHLRSCGIVVPLVAQFGASGRLPVARRSFVICDALDGYRSLEDLLEGPEAVELDARLRLKLARGLGQMIGQLHRAGVNHRDLYVCHCFYSTEAFTRGRFELGLIDLHRAQIRQVTPRRWRVRDVGALLFSCLDRQPTHRERAIFARAYARALEADVEESFWCDVERRAERLAGREARRSGRGADRP